MASYNDEVVLNFKMNGQVQYAKTLKEINAVMDTAAKEYKNHIAAMGNDASATDKLRAEKQKLEIQMEGAQKRTKMLRDEYEAMSKDTNATTAQLTKLYGKLLDSEKAEISLQKSLERVNGGLSEQSQEAREAQDILNNLKDESAKLEVEQKKLTSAFNLQNSELGENATEFEKVELAQQQLRQQMSLTDRAINNLEQQLEATKKVYGENSIEVMQMEAKLNDARGTVNKFKRSLEGVEDSAEKAERSMDGLKNGFAAIGGAAPAAAIGGLVSSMEEYNVSLARLRTNASNAGFDLEGIEKGFEKIVTVTGEADSAVETMSNLMATGFSDQQLSQVIEDINGAAIRFSDTLKTEGIADGLQETFATGEAVGQFGELLERSGVKLETFNKGLAKAKKNGSETDYVLQQMSKLGLASAYDEYKKLNPEVVAQQEAQQAMTSALSDLSIILTPLVTKVAEFTTKIIEWANENPKLITSIGIGAVAIGGLITALATVAPIVTAIIGVMGAASISFGAVVAPIIAIVAGIGLLIAAMVAAYNNSETFRETVNTAFQKIKEVALQVFEIVASFIGEKIAQIKQFWDENGAQILKAAQNLFNGIKKVIEFVMPFALSIVRESWSAIKNVFNGALKIILGLIKTFSGLFTGDFKKMWEGTKQMFSGAVEAVWGILQLGFLGKIFKIIKSFGGKAVDVIKDMAGRFKSKFSEIVSSAKSKFDDVKSKILAPIESAKDKISGIIDTIKGFFDNLKLKIPTPSLPKLPKFSLETSTKSIMGKKITFPTGFDIDWRAKGAIFTRPTIFGMNNGRLQGAGDAGPEAALPLNEETLGAIGRGIASTMKGNGVTQHITIVSPDHTSPSENARKMKQASRQLAMEWRG